MIMAVSDFWDFSAMILFVNPLDSVSNMNQFNVFSKSHAIFPRTGRRFSTKGSKAEPSRSASSCTTAQDCCATVVRKLVSYPDVLSAT